jgi:hypothetical protein
MILFGAQEIRNRGEVEKRQIPSNKRCLVSIGIIFKEMMRKKLSFISGGAEVLSMARILNIA